MKIVLDVTGLSPKQFAHAKQVLKDALGEFKSVRTPVAKYVAERYNNQPASFRRAKEDEVFMRNATAETLHAAVDRAEIDP